MSPQIYIQADIVQEKTEIIENVDEDKAINQPDNNDDEFCSMYG